MTKTEAAEQWLREYLLSREGYRAPSKKIKLVGKKAGHSERTLKRASYKLIVKVTRTSSVPSVTWWELPSWEKSEGQREKKKAPAAEKPKAANPWLS